MHTDITTTRRYVWGIFGEFNTRATRKKICLRYSWWIQHSCHTEEDMYGIFLANSTLKWGKICVGGISVCINYHVPSPRIPHTYLLPCGTSVEFTKNTSNISSSIWHECWIRQEYPIHIFFRVARVLNSPRISQTYIIPYGTSVEFTKNTSKNICVQ
jgi:hypothetical protein